MHKNITCDDKSDIETCWLYFCWKYPLFGATASSLPLSSFFTHALIVDSSILYFLAASLFDVANAQATTSLFTCICILFVFVFVVVDIVVDLYVHLYAVVDNLMSLGLVVTFRLNSK